MAILGAGGSNGNFSPAFTVPASMVCVGYAVGGPAAATPWYRSIDLQGALTGAWPRSRYSALVPQSKVAAVKAVLDAESLLYKPTYGIWPWGTILTTRGWNDLRLFLSHPKSTGGAWTAARLTTLLGSLHTAITT